jgi:hypothetical protein
MTNFLYYIRSVPPINALLIVCVRLFKMLKLRILKILFRMLLGLKAFPLSR